jgi:hypothetical protein
MTTYNNSKNIMDKFTKPTQVANGGIDANEWFNGYYVQNGGLTGNGETVKVTRKDGSLSDLDVADAAIIFKDFVMHRTGSADYNFYDICTFGTVGSNSVMARPMALVSCSETWIPGFLNNKSAEHALTRGRGSQMYLVHPISLFKKGMSDDDLLRSRCLLEQCARFWVSAGSNNIDMDLQHVSNMYVCQQSSIVYHMFDDMLKGIPFSDPSKNLFYMLYYHARSMTSFMEIFSDIIKPIKALNEAEFSCDVLQRLVSCAITGYKLNLDDYIRMIELSLKRSFKRHSGERKFTVDHAPGLTALLLFGSYHRKIFHDQQTPLEVQFKQFTDDFNDVFSKIKARSTGIDDVTDSNLIFIEELLNRSEIAGKLTIEQVKNLYKFCMNWNNRLIDFNIDDIIKSPEVKFSYDNKNIKIRSHPLINRCRLIMNGNSLSLIGKDPTTWSGIQFKSNGVYKFNPTILGYATEGKNNTRKDHMTAVIQFTTGNNILPIKKYLISSAGEILVKADKKIYNYKQHLDLTKPFTLTIERNEFTVEQDNKIFSVSSTKNSIVLMAFKYIKLELCYQSGDLFEFDKRAVNKLIRQIRSGHDFNEKKRKRAKSLDNSVGFGLPELVIDELEGM